MLPIRLSNIKSGSCCNLSHISVSPVFDSIYSQKSCFQSFVTLGQHSASLIPAGQALLPRRRKKGQRSASIYYLVYAIRKLALVLSVNN